MQYTNTPAWGAASTAASTRPRKIEKKRERSKVIHMPATVLSWCNNVKENEAEREDVAFNDKVVVITQGMCCVILV